MGPDVIKKWAETAPASLLKKVEVLGNKKFLDTLPAELGKRPVGDFSFEARAGEPSAEGCKIAELSLETAARGCVCGEYFGVTTAPISKFEMRKIGFNYPGHTEFFAERWGGIPVMCFAGREILVSLVTWHDALAGVPKLLDFGRISRAVESAAELAKKLRWLENPKIAVCGFNPHAGEGGLMGREEIDVIEPALKRARAKGLSVTGPWPADTIFVREHERQYDAVLCMYHDQGLPVLKREGFGHGVNVTLGLPWIRTSVDHGTALDIAGKGIADAGSMTAALHLARRMAHRAQRL